MNGTTQEQSQIGHIIQIIGEAVEIAGVLVIVLGLIVATIFFFRNRQRRPTLDDAYNRYRQNIGRTLLLGLEILVAGDIIRTVAVDPTLNSVAVLAGIVLIRTFLSWSLEVEIEGRWPWQKEQRPESSTMTDTEPDERHAVDRSNNSDKAR